MYFHKPILPGAVLRSRAAPIGIHVKQSGTTVVSRMETRDEAGELVNEQYSVTFFRGVTGGEGKGEAAPEHRFPEELRSSDPAAVAEAVDVFWSAKRPLVITGRGARHAGAALVRLLDVTGAAKAASAQCSAAAIDGAEGSVRRSSRF